MKRIRREFSLVVALVVVVLGAMALTRAAVVKTSKQDTPVSAAPEIRQASKPESTFFPVAVWYSGGKARAPMLGTITPDSRLWKEDLLKIKSLGFNAVRTWVEWNVGERQEGQCHLENLDLLLHLADEVGLKLIVQVYVDSAPQWVAKNIRMVVMPRRMDSRSPRRLHPDIASTNTDLMDWRVYYGHKLAEDLKLRNDAVKAVDPEHVTTSHAPNPLPLVRTLADRYDPTDDFLMKDSVDFFGTSFPRLKAIGRSSGAS